ncbi:hypothetical protein L1049_000092 [Liquidambar formosana]|uniref:Sugar phosphate transporter domain-containing protein n=1 Tax=Liquidambar formosana TaxID=63359 RepID=A0AAP0N949_LIQFO
MDGGRKYTFDITKASEIFDHTTTKTDMDNTNLNAYISIIAFFVYIPPAILLEGPQLIEHGFNDAIAKVGILATNTIEMVAPLTHAVGNVLKRVLVIGFLIIVFGNKISTQTGIGTCIAITGIAIYSYIKAKMEEEKQGHLVEAS